MPSSTPYPFPDLSSISLNFPTHPLLHSALTYTQAHTTPTTVNHCLRSAAFALLAAQKLPHLKDGKTDTVLVVLACILHDMGWSKTLSLRSPDKRFEVDGANLGRAWMQQNLPSNDANDLNWGPREEQILWDAIALHTTPSIATHKESIVCAAAIGIAADFFGSKFPGGLFTFAEQKAIVEAFPRLGFADEVVEIMCGLCREKPETTYDNFVSGFGVKFGLGDGGKTKEEFAREVEGRSVVVGMMTVLRANEEEERVAIEGS